MNHIGSIFAMAVCLAMSAYFSATETAFKVRFLFKVWGLTAATKIL